MRRIVIIVGLLLGLGLVSSIALAWASATMSRMGSPDNPMTNTWLNEPKLEFGQANHWRIAQWTDATQTRRWAWGWRSEWFEDPAVARMRRISTSDWDPSESSATLVLPPFSRGRQPAPEEAPSYGILLDALPSFLEREAGWPMRCLRVRWIAGDDRLDTPGERLRGGVLASYWVFPWGWGRGTLHPPMIGWSPEDEHALPLTPMWAGLIVNTLTWAAIWFIVLLVFPLPIWLWRRRRWRKRERRGLCAHCAYELDVADDPITRCPECGMVMGRRPSWSFMSLPRLAAVSLVLLVVLTAGFAMTRMLTADRLPPLHQSAAHGDIERARSLIAGGAAIDVNAPELRTHNISPMQAARPIEWAAARGHAGIIDELIMAGADPGMVGDERSPLALAIACGHDDAADILLAAGAPVAEVPRNTPAPIAVAAWFDDAALLERLFDEADARGSGSVPLDLFLVTLAGRSAKVQNIVLDRAASTPQAIEEQAVFAFRFDDLDLLDELIDRGFDPRSASDHFLAYAVDMKDPRRAIEVLVDRGVDPTAVGPSGQTPLHLMAQRRDASDALRLLVQMGNPLDATIAGRTPLHLAAAAGNAANIVALLEMGANADLRDADGSTPRDLWWRGGNGSERYREIRALLEEAERR
ncbi:MAG: ankyrin repeat domain-containing protein [Phycisphaerales bacterium JB060]